MATLSICVLFRRDTSALHACLQSLADRPEEIVVVDRGEGGGVPRLEGGIPVVRPPWDGDEGQLRRRAAQVVRGTHVLFLEATERVADGAIDAIQARLTGETIGMNLPVVEADNANANLQTVVQGAGRLGEPELQLRVLCKRACRTWEGVQRPRADVDEGLIPTIQAWIVSTASIRAEASPDEVDGRWIRATVAAPGDPLVLAGAARRMVDRGQIAVARALADRALSLASPGEGLVEATVAAALCALQSNEAESGLELLISAKKAGEDHPDIDLLMGLAGLELDTADSLAMAERHLRAALARDGEQFVTKPLPGATSTAARVGLATVTLAQSDPDGARDALSALPPLTRRGMAARLLQAETALDEGRPEEALRILVDRLESCGADGWILAACAAERVGRGADALAFVDRAEERLADGLLAPHRARRLTQVRAILSAGAVRDRLTGDAVALPTSVDPREEGERASANGEPERAHALLIEALRRDPGDVTAWVSLGVVFHEAGASEPAALALRMAVELEPQRPELRVQLAAVSWAGGHVSDAAVQARSAVDGGAGSDAAALLAALDIEGEARGCVAVVAPAAQTEDWVGLIRLGRCRPVVPHSDLLAALSPEGRAARLAWLTAAAPALVLLDEHPEAEAWVESCTRQGRRVLWVGQGPGPAGAEVAPADLLTTLAAVPRRRATGLPAMSVVIATRDRRHSLVALLDRLALQDLPPAMLEVIVVDDGSKEPIRRIDMGDRPWPVRVVRVEGEGPAVARNRGVERARARILWFLDDDARPALDAARGHLVGQLSSESPAALVGGFSLLERHRRTVWDHLVDANARRGATGDRPLGATLNWMSFAVSNTSMPRAVLREVGGFDGVSFPDPANEDVELGYRLAQAGVALVDRWDLHCGHDHRIGVDEWLARSTQRGRAQWALQRATGGAAQPSGAVLDALRSMIELRAGRVAQAIHALRRLGSAKLPSDPDLRAQLLARARSLAQVVGDDAHHRGLVQSVVGERAPSPAALGTTSVVLAHDPTPHRADSRLEEIVEGIRRNTAGPVEVVVAYSGSAGPRLASWADVVRVRVDEARSSLELWQAGARVSAGETLFFCDDGVLFTPGWRRRLIAHIDAWSDVGAVSALGARSRDGLDRAAVGFGADHEGEHAWPVRPSLARVMVRRSVLEQVGGPDPQMGGLASADWAIRVRRGGFRVRMAGDVLIGAIDEQHTASTQDIRAFKARYGTVSVARDSLRALADWQTGPIEMPESSYVSAEPARPVLLDPVAVSPCVAQAVTNREEGTALIQNSQGSTLLMSDEIELAATG